MEEIRDFLVRHPGLTGLAFAVLVGACGFNAFRGGMAYADLRAAVADQARVASEALGG